MEEEKQEGKALPDWFYVKQEMLLSFFNATACLSNYLTTEKNNKEALTEAEKWIIDLFFKVESKINFNKEGYEVLAKLDEFINDGTKMKFLDWRNSLAALGKKLKEMGVMEIELPPEKKMKHPLLRGNRYGLS